jgi:NAD+ kinase
MKKIGIYPNTSKGAALASAKDLMAFVEVLGIECYIITSDEPITDVDFLVVLGGDGTMLRAARQTAMNEIPLLGINIGKLGYLTDVEPDGAKDAIFSVISGDYKTEKRMMLQAVIDDDAARAPLLALNDFCITRGAYVRLLEFEIWVNGEYIETLSADGLIICTPTGSTAYNLSAGGPILIPDAEMIAVTPICPHALHARPFVLSSKDEVVVKVAIANEKTLSNIVYVDGVVFETHLRSKVAVKRSEHTATIIKTSSKGFYDVLRRKMIDKV